jgi:hypothetical protein
MGVEAFCPVAEGHIIEDPGRSSLEKGPEDGAVLARCP